MLKVIRQNLGLKQRRISAMLGHTNSSLLSTWENEKALPNCTSLMKLCIIYNKTPQQLYPEYYEEIMQHLDSL